MGRNSVKKWDGVRGSRSHCRGGLKARDTRADILNEVFTSLNAFGSGGFGGNEERRSGAES